VVNDPRGDRPQFFWPALGNERDASTALPKREQLSRKIRMPDGGTLYIVNFGKRSAFR
jgi:hypothetical protein